MVYSSNPQNPSLDQPIGVNWVELLNSLTIDPISYADLYAGPPYIMHVYGEASLKPNPDVVVQFSYAIGENGDYSNTETYFTNIPHKFNATKPLIDTDGLFDSLNEKYSIPDSFDEASLSLPKTSAYSNSYWEYRHQSIPIPVPDDFLVSFPNQSPEFDYVHGISGMKSFDQIKKLHQLSCEIPDTFSIPIYEPFVLESRDFYEYKTISLKFKPGTNVRFHPWPIVKSHEWNPSTHTLDIVLNPYEEQFTGQVMTYSIYDNNQFMFQKTLIIE